MGTFPVTCRNRAFTSLEITFVCVFVSPSKVLFGDFPLLLSPFCRHSPGQGAGLGELLMIFPPASQLPSMQGRVLTWRLQPSTIFRSESSHVPCHWRSSHRGEGWGLTFPAAAEWSQPARCLLETCYLFISECVPKNQYYPFPAESVKNFHVDTSCEGSGDAGESLLQPMRAPCGRCQVR